MTPAVVLLLLLAQDVSIDAALRNIAAKDPQDADARFRLGLVLLKEAKIEEAAAALAEATKLEPRSDRTTSFGRGSEMVAEPRPKGSGPTLSEYCENRRRFASGASPNV